MYRIQAAVCKFLYTLYTCTYIHAFIHHYFFECSCLCVPPLIVHHPSQAKLEKLNSIVWPEIWRLAEEKIARAHSDGHRVCVIDAAVMLNAGWQNHMHEVWVAIAPDAEVSDHPNPFLYVTLLAFRLEPWDMECVIFL